MSHIYVSPPIYYSSSYFDVLELPPHQIFMLVIYKLVVCGLLDSSLKGQGKLKINFMKQTVYPLSRS